MLGIRHQPLLVSTQVRMAGMIKIRHRPDVGLPLPPTIQKSLVMLRPTSHVRIFSQAQAREATQLVPSASAVTLTQFLIARRPLSITAPTNRLSRSVSTRILSYDHPALRSASTGRVDEGVMSQLTTSVTDARDVERLLMEHRSALKERRREALTPYHPEAWEANLKDADLWDKYSHLADGFRFGFKLDFPNICTTQTPPNSPAVVQFAEEFRKIINSEIQKK